MNNLKNQFLGFINTSSLFEELNGLSQFELDLNEINDFDYSSLTIPNNLPLGKRIEYFFQFYIQQSKNYELIKSNIQVIKDKQTLGELDFLLFDKCKEKYLHIEHIYKFYLYDESFSNEIDRFIGPNKNDSFSKKLTKLKNKQLPLLFKDETQNYLEGIDLDLLEQKVCFKGNIYLPFDFKSKEIPIVNNSCIKGFYLSFKEFMVQKQFREYEYFLPLRDDWICDCFTNETWKSFDETVLEIDIILSYKKSSLVWIKNKKENKYQSFFVTWW